MTRVYVSGPMSGIRACNIPAFDRAAQNLRAQGHDVVSPAELDSPEFREACLKLSATDPLPEGESWGKLLARDVQLLADDGIEAIVVLPGWARSRGATLETYVGRLCGLPILYYPDLKVVPLHTLERVHGAATQLPLPGKNFPPIDGLEGATEREALWRDPIVNQAYRSTAKLYIADHEGRQDETIITDPETGGMKGTKNAVLGDICPKALMLVAQVAGFGRKKYSRLNYLKGFDWSLSYDAAQRHLHEFWDRQDTDPESGLPHLAHAAWQCLALLAFTIRGLGSDDRP